MNKTKIFTAACALLLSIAHGINVSVADTSTDLFVAVMSGDATKVGQLLAGGADPNFRAQGGVTPLMGAALGGNAEIVTLLLDKGADINAKTKDGFTALMFAATKGHKEVTQLLLDKGADANIRASSGFNAFQMAASGSHEEVAELLQPRTKGADSVRIKTVVGPLEGKQKCLPVTKSPDEVSEKVACLKAGVEVSTAGESGDGKWAILQKPASGWVPMTAIRKVFVTQAQTKHAAPRSSRGTGAPSSAGESGISSKDMPETPRGMGGESWRR